MTRLAPRQLAAYWGFPLRRREIVLSARAKSRSSLVDRHPQQFSFRHPDIRLFKADLESFDGFGHRIVFGLDINQFALQFLFELE